MDAEELTRMFELFEGTQRQGPGSEATTRRALASLPEDHRVERVLDLGCGTGGSTLVLAAELGAQVVAVDIHPPFLATLRQQAAERGVSERISTNVADMAGISALGEGYDLLWAEGSAYTIGYDNALRTWRPLLRPGGCLVVSQLTWFAEQPSEGARAYFATEYPAMQHESECVGEAREAGYRVLDSFRLPSGDWRSYYAGVRSAMQAAIARHGDGAVFEALRREEAIFEAFGDEYGYVCLTLQVTPEAATY